MRFKGENFPREGGSFPLAGQRQAQRAAARDYVMLC